MRKVKFRIKDGTILEGEPVEETADYEFMGDWKNKAEEVLVIDKPEKKIFINKKFASGSRFGDDCIFIKCIFGSNCSFGSDCNFGFCKFGYNCEFDSYCTFGSGCNFGSKCIKNLP